MKLNEILDPAQRERILKGMQKMYAPHQKEPSQEELKNRTNRNTALQAARQEAEALLEPIAKKYDEDDFEGFEAEATQVLTPQQLKSINLRWAFDFFNPARRQQSKDSWEEIADEKYRDNYRGD